MKSTTVTIKNKDQHPIQKLADAAQQLVDILAQAHRETNGATLHPQIKMPIWIDAERKMLITIEQGPQTEADYVIFKAQNGGKA